MKKSNKTLVCAAILGVSVLGGSAARAAEQANIQSGKWELTMSMEIEGQPSTPPTVFTKCEKALELKSPEAMMGRAQRDGKCKFSNVKTASDKMSWAFTCSNGAQGSGEAIYAGTTYESTMHLNIVRPKGTTKMTQHIKGKRVGDC